MCLNLLTYHFLTVNRKVMNYIYYIGIDVSKKTLDFTVLQGKNQLFHLQTLNCPEGIKGFMNQLKNKSGFKLEQAVFCMEHTGIYNKHLLDFFFKKKANICLEISVKIKGSSGLERGKNDKIDSFRIAQYAYKNKEELKIWQPKREVVRKLGYLSGVRTRLINAKKQLTLTVKETAGFDKVAARQMHKLCKSSIDRLEKDIAKTEKAMDEVIASDETLSRLFKIVTSVEGIGRVTATEIIVTSNEFKDISCPKKYACYSGVVPFGHTSGTSIKGKPRISNKANKSVKTLLHMAALTAVCYNEDLKKYYERKVKENKNKMLVINAVRNKLLHRIYACVRENRLYQKNMTKLLVKP